LAWRASAGSPVGSGCWSSSGASASDYTTNSLACPEKQAHHAYRLSDALGRGAIAARLRDFPDTATLARALNDFERHYNEIAKPFDWNFTRQDLAELLQHLDQPTSHDLPLALAA
jgi:hypothetical protein